MDALGINVGFLIAQMVNFSVFVIAFTYLGWKPLMKMLDARSERIAKGLEDARIASEARETAEQDAEKILTDARAEANRIKAEARAEADKSAEPILEAARADADKIRTDADARAKDAEANALAGLRGQVVNLALAAANQVIGESMKDEAKAKEVVNEFFSTSQTDISGLSGDLVVTTALPLEKADQDKLAGQLGGTVTEWRVDPNILGGVVVRAGNRVVDGSVRANLNKLAASLN